MSVAPQTISRLCDYHMQSSSLDAGCITASSSCSMPMDSPCAPEDKGSGPLSHGPPGRDLHPNADPALLRKMLPNLHSANISEPVFGTVRDGCHRMPKIKETTACTELRKARGEDAPSASSKQVNTTPPSSNISTDTDVPKQDPANPHKQNRIPGPPPSSLPCDPGSLRCPQRGRVLKRTSNRTAGSRSFDTLMEKTRATIGGMCLQSPESPDPKPQKWPAGKRLFKSYSQGSVSSHPMSSRDRRSGPVMLPVPKDAKLLRALPKRDVGVWRCHGPFSHCFNKKRSTIHEDEDGESFPWLPLPRNPKPSASESRGDAEEAVFLGSSPAGDADPSGMSFIARLARVGALKDRTYNLPSGFSAARQDASELIALIRSNVGENESALSEVHEDSQGQYKQLLSMESQELGSACRKMALSHSSPDELLLAITCSFRVLCCLTEAFMCLLRGTKSETRQRELVTKVDEVVMNYICLLKAAESAWASNPSDHSAGSLARHSTTMSAIVNALTCSLKTLLNQ
ncbi:hypothetical protein AAFF_G00287390 [Aldrovandia affinis]|uniref:Uncharacterized protein n=1 Tax=Aldrovandia affinis TaxID=143900 RepID=A0AAD7SR35_9TELE|nr:hypothetical protein AAFF_G00287390 [Aldrovandia affinis]